MIPNIFHFVFGMSSDFGHKPFSLPHYLSVKSAIELNKPETAWFHCQYEPVGEYWERIKSGISINKIKAPSSFMGRPLYHFAHKADVIRLQVLKETGGIYLDLDTISVKPLTELLNHSFVIGEEVRPEYKPKNWRQAIKSKIGVIKTNTGKTAGLCNAVLLSEKNSDFVNHWLNSYKTFRSKGRDIYWNEHSVKIPGQLANNYPSSLTKLNGYAFHYPLFNQEGLMSMFEEVHSFPEAYLHHLWETFSWDAYLSKLTADRILNEDNTYNLIARKFL